MDKDWKDVVNYEDYFMVSNRGEIYSKRTKKILKQVTAKNGYKHFSTKIGGRTSKDVTLKIHRLVAEAFLGEPSQELKDSVKYLKYKSVPVNHKDGNKSNNDVNNLEWTTYSGNMKHAALNNLLKIKTGSDNPSSKLKESDIIEIRKIFKSRCRKFGARALAKIYGVDKTSIMRVVNKETWKKI